MSQNAPILSIICVFRNRKEWIEPTLQALYSLENIPCEFLFTDDGSTDGSQDTLRSLVEHYRHEDTFLFENLTARGRGNSINSALEMARGQFLWMPERVDGVDEAPLSQALETMVQTQALFGMVVPDELAVTPMDWLQLLYNDRLPYDRDCLFHLRKIPPYFKYADPHWSVRHASEWAIRLHTEAEPVAIPVFCKGDTSRLEMDDRSRKECALSLMRIPGLSLSGQEKAFRMLRSYGSSDYEKDTGSMDVLFEEAQLLFKAGNSVRAMELLDRILAAEPAHRRARDFKVEILYKLRRFVEAAEVKHGYKPPLGPEREPFDPQADEKLRAPVQSDPTAPAPESETEADIGSEPESSPGLDSKPEQEEAAVVSGAPDDSPPAVGDEDAPGAALEPDTPDEPGTEDAPGAALEPDAAEEPGTEDAPGAALELDAADEPGTEDAPGATLEPDTADEPGTEDAPGATLEPDTADEPGPDTADEPGTEDAPKAIEQLHKPPVEQQPALTIVIPTAGGQRQTLQRCLDSVMRYTEASRTQIIVVDNASLDDTDSIFSGDYSGPHEIIVIHNEENIGFAGAVNQGLSKASNEWVVIMHNDVVLTSPVPGRLVRILENNPSAGLVVPMADHTWNRWQHTGVSGTLFDEPVTPWPPQQSRLEWLFDSDGLSAGSPVPSTRNSGVHAPSTDAAGSPAPSTRDLSSHTEQSAETGKSAPTGENASTEQGAQTGKTPGTGQRSESEQDHTVERPDHLLLEVPFVETFCMALRNEPGLAMSKSYGLGYFDDVDFCLRMQRKNKRVLIARGEKVKHLGGRTSGDLGLAMPNKTYWRNLSVFQNEWDLSPVLPDDFDRQDPLRKLVLIGERINPHFPEKKLLDLFDELFTSELRTRLLNTRFTPGHLEALIHLMMATNQREVLRKLEEQLDPLFPNNALYHHLVLFYFDRTIYSRCKLYIERLNPSTLPFHFKLLQLGIAIGEKDYTHAAGLLQPLMDELPTHPQVLASAAEMHRKSGNPGQAAKFLNLAQRLNPYLKTQNGLRT